MTILCTQFSILISSFLLSTSALHTKRTSTPINRFYVSVGLCAYSKGGEVLDATRNKMQFHFHVCVCGCGSHTNASDACYMAFVWLWMHAPMSACVYEIARCVTGQRKICSVEFKFCFLFKTRGSIFIFSFDIFIFNKILKKYRRRRSGRSSYWFYLEKLVAMLQI